MEKHDPASHTARLLRLLVEQTRDYALFVLDPTGRIVSWNVGAQQIKGYRREEIIGEHFSRFYLPAAVESGWPDYELRMATREGRFEDEGWRVRKDGSRFWASVVITALRDEDGTLLGFSKITRDLSERKQHEEALRLSEERFRLLVDGVVDYAIYMLDPEGMVSSWNVGAERIEGYLRDEVLGTHFSRFYTPEDIEKSKPWNELTVARREGRTEDEGWRVRKDGSRFWARVVISALRDAEGHLRGFAKVTQDLSERRHIQDLEQAARNVQEFIATLAHELRNPLAPIRSAMQTLARIEVAEPTVSALHEVIDRQSAHLARIVDDMIDTTRISRGAIDIVRVPVEVHDVLRASIEVVEAQIEAARHRLEVRCEGRICVEGDQGRLTQLVTNLLTNAVRYTQQGGQIALEARVDGNDAVISVRDNGRGIDAEYIERIFNMFVQGRPALERVGAGMGVGLALSRRIAELHGGTLLAHSEGAGKGACFELRLPLSAGDPPVRPKAASREAVASQAYRVLVVDDNVDAAESMALLLDELGNQTEVAHDGPAALAACGRFSPDTVLLDIGLPGMDGYEVARCLRELQPDLRIIALTGWGQAADRARTQAAGFDLHLLKPVELEPLVAAIRGGR
ncbi:PAS domain S-box protein [Niveibacterium sp. SC-1]|uniref:PAS domain-containing hybrid sensor histidine kinase/response regulator n=1 Tax=Niveibacterium sp. SC-1 TaxID=3135646 RepID=UPI00311F27A1